MGLPHAGRARARLKETLGAPLHDERPVAVACGAAPGVITICTLDVRPTQMTGSTGPSKTAVVGPLPIASHPLRDRLPRIPSGWNSLISSNLK